jgi:hypothetical protein
MLIPVWHKSTFFSVTDLLHLNCWSYKGQKTATSPTSTYCLNLLLSSLLWIKDLLCYFCALKTVLKKPNTFELQPCTSSIIQTPRGGVVLFGKLILAQLVNNSLPFMETEGSLLHLKQSTKISALETVHQNFLSWAKWIQSMPTQPISLRSVLLLPPPTYTQVFHVISLPFRFCD